MKSVIMILFVISTPFAFADEINFDELEWSDTPPKITKMRIVNCDIEDCNDSWYSDKSESNNADNFLFVVITMFGVGMFVFGFLFGNMKNKKVQQTFQKVDEK